LTVHVINSRHQSHTPQTHFISLLVFFCLKIQEKLLDLIIATWT